MKTIREWLRTGLNSEHYLSLSQYEPMYDWDHNCSLTLEDALYNSVSWINTHEGYAFWESMMYDIEHGRYKKNSNIFLKV